MMMLYQARLPKELADRLRKWKADTGGSFAHAFREGVALFLERKGY